MPNQFVFNDNDQPVFVEMVNTFRSPDISAPPEISASKNAVLYSTNGSTFSPQLCLFESVMLWVVGEQFMYHV